MADTDFVTEAQANALVTSVAANASTSVVYLDIGANASAARTAGSAYQYWIADNGVTPINSIEGDLVYNRAV